MKGEGMSRGIMAQEEATGLLSDVAGETATGAATRLSEAAHLYACPGCRAEASCESLETHGTSYRLACGSCGLQFWWPLTGAGADWYAAHGTTTADWCDSLVRPGHRRFLAQPPIRSGRLLDIGCGHGLFLSLARDHAGLEVWGLDWDVRAVEFGRRCRGLNHLYAQSIEAFAAARRGAGFDAVTLFEVLEHQDDPGACLTRAAALLKPGAVLAGSVPNRDRLVIGPREGWDYPPQHLLWFHPPSLMTLLQRTGFEDIRIQPLLDTAALTHQILARFSWGLASRVVQMPEPPASNVTELGPGEWSRLKARPAPIGYRMMTSAKKLLLAPVLVPALLLGQALPSLRHTLYFEARRAGGAAA